jgi:adenylate cyclase
MTCSCVSSIACSSRAAWRRSGSTSPSSRARTPRPSTEALALYRARRFEEAAELWEKLATQEPPGAGRGGENPPAVMARHAREFLAQPPPADWDGVTRLATK